MQIASLLEHSENTVHRLEYREVASDSATQQGAAATS